MKLIPLKELFAAFVRARAIGRHFHRLAILDAFRGVTVAREVPPALAKALIAASAANADALLTQLGSHPDGLTESRADTIRSRVGLNAVEQEKPLPWWIHVWHCYRNPFNLLLTLPAIVSYYTEDMRAAIVISTMIVLSTLVRFVQESRSNRAADKLKEMVSNTATVLRRHASEEAAPVFQQYYGVALRVKPPQRVEVSIKQ